MSPRTSVQENLKKPRSKAGRRVNPEERAQKRREIMNASAELFTKFGFERTSVQMIADKAGINVALLYYYFPSKDAILFEVLKFALEGLIKVTRRAVQEAEIGPEKKLSAFVQSHILYQSEAYSSSPLYTARSLVLSDAKESIKYKSILSQLERKNFQDLINIIDMGISEGKFSVPDRIVTAFGIIGLSEHFNHWFREGRALSTHDVANISAQLALRMVGYKE